MSRGRDVEERIERRLRRYGEESLMKTKCSEEFEVIEEVSDRLTLEALYELMRKKMGLLIFLFFLKSRARIWNYITRNRKSC